MSTKHTDQSPANAPHVYTDHELDQLHRVRNKPKNERAVLLAQVLGVSPAWLVFGVGEP